MSHARSRMARFVSPERVSSEPFLTAFYREEFLKHRERLAQQREYYSERAITDADGAISRVLSELEPLCDLHLIAAAAIRACDARALLLRALDAHPLASTATYNVVAAGKAGQRMADAFLERYAARTRDVVIARGGHPIPDEQSFAAGAAALRLADTN